MNKEVGYVMQGFLLTLVVFAGVRIAMVLESPLFVSLTSEEKGLGCGVKEPVATAIIDPIALTGQKLFQDNCASCHMVAKDLTGPALAGVEERVKDRKLLRRWIRNNAAVLKSGNVYFNKLYNKWNQTSMAIFPSFTDEDIDAILAYTMEYKLKVQE